MSSANTLVIGSHNIRGGIANKLQFFDVDSLVRKHDIFCFQETWLVKSKVMSIPGYKILRSDRGKSKKKNRGSGGVCIVHKLQLEKGIIKLGSKNKDLIWVKLDKTFFGLKNDIYLCSGYIPPEQSDLHKQPDTDYFETLQKEISQYSTIGDIILLGDLNSRTADMKENYDIIEEDTVLDDRSSINGSLNREEIDQILNKYGPRSNEDIVVNSFGRQLMSVIEQSFLAIVNGRKIGDLTGKLTYVGHNGTSTVDYCITSISLFQDILIFSVLEQEWYSDHNPISLALKVNKNPPDAFIDPDLSAVWKFMWNDSLKEKYTSNFNKDQHQKSLRGFINTKYTDPNTALDSLAKIITAVGKESLPVKNSSVKNNSGKNQYASDNDKLLTAEKREFNKIKRGFLNDKTDANRRIQFIRARSKYRKIKYYVQNSQKQNRIYKLAEIESKDPKEFWKILKRILSDKMAQKPNISASNWVEYFKELLNIKSASSNNSFSQYIQQSLPVLENVSRNKYHRDKEYIEKS